MTEKQVAPLPEPFDKSQGMDLPPDQDLEKLKERLRLRVNNETLVHYNADELFREALDAIELQEAMLEDREWLSSIDENTINDLRAKLDAAEKRAKLAEHIEFDYRAYQECKDDLEKALQKCRWYLRCSSSSS